MTSPFIRPEIKELLFNVLMRDLDEEQLFRIRELEKRIRTEQNITFILKSLGVVGAIAGNRKVEWSRAFLAQANQIKQEWNPSNWKCDEIARAILLITWAESEEKFTSKLKLYFSTASLEEINSILKVLPLLPESEKFMQEAALGVRSNMKSVFESIALDNPFPAEHFEIDAWNQMVLKALFIGSPLYRIVGLDERANTKLSVMFRDFAHEKWAAGRKVCPEMWRIITPFIKRENIKDLNKIFERGTDTEKLAVILTCFNSTLPELKGLVSQFKNLEEEIVSGNINWDLIGQRWEESQAKA
jgi:hypothetical protein